MVPKLSKQISDVENIISSCSSSFTGKIQSLASLSQTTILIDIHPCKMKGLDKACMCHCRARKEA